MVLVCSEKGKVYSFGSNKYGCLGLVHPTPSAMTTPTIVEPMKSVVKVSCGRLHSAAIDGECTCYLSVNIDKVYKIQKYCVV